MSKLRVGIRSTALCLLVTVAICCLPPCARAEGARRVVVSVDTSGSMWAIGNHGQARVKAYLAQVLFGGLNPAALASDKDRISSGADEDWLQGGLCSGSLCTVTYFEFSSGTGAGVPIKSAEELLSVYPTNFEGQTNLGTAAERACSELSGTQLGVDELYWVYVSDNIIESVDARSQREKLSQVARENWIQPVFSMSVFDEAWHAGASRTFTGTVYIEVRRVHSVERVALMADALAELLDKLEEALKRPDTDYAQLLEQLEEIKRQLSQMNWVLLAFSENPKVKDLQARVGALEEEVVRVKNLATPPGSFAILFPENGSTLTDSEVELRWTPAERAAQYQVNVRGPDGTQLVELTDRTMYTLSPKAATGSYAWAVNAIGEPLGERAPLVTSCDGGIHTFELTAPETQQRASFYLLAPSSDAASVAGAAEFEWQVVDGLEDYILMIRMPDGTMSEYQGTAGKAVVNLEAGAHEWTVRASSSPGKETVEAANGPRSLLVAVPPAPTPAPFAPVVPRPSAREQPGPVKFQWTSAGDGMTYSLEVIDFGSGETLDPVSTTETAIESILEPGVYTWRVVARNADGTASPMRGDKIRFAVRSAGDGGGAWWLALVSVLAAAILFGVRAFRARATRFTIEETNEAGDALASKDFVIETGPPDNAVRLGESSDDADVPVFDVGAPDALIKRGWFGGFRIEKGGSKRALKEGKAAQVVDAFDRPRWVVLRRRDVSVQPEGQDPLSELDHLDAKGD